MRYSCVMPSTHCSLRIHLIFATKYRQPLITPEVRTELYPFIGGVLARQNAILLAIGGMPDHLHLFVGLPATTVLADLVQAIKGSSAKWLNERAIRTERFSWQAGYGAFSVSRSDIPMIRTYIERQEDHHRKTSFQDELDQILRDHGYEPDSNFLAGPPAPSDHPSGVAPLA